MNEFFNVNQMKNRKKCRLIKSTITGRATSNTRNHHFWVIAWFFLFVETVCFVYSCSDKHLGQKMMRRLRTSSIIPLDISSMFTLQHCFTLVDVHNSNGPVLEGATLLFSYKFVNTTRDRGAVVDLLLLGSHLPFGTLL